MDIKRLYIGLLKWFQTNPVKMRTFASIENISRKLYEQNSVGQDLSKAKYKLFFPLIKYGVIEFYGNNQYGLSPTSFLIKEDLILGCNLPLSVQTELSNDICFDTELGLEVYKKTDKTIEIINKNNFSIQNFNFSSIFSRIKSFDETITTWEEDIIFDTNGFQHYNNGEWDSLSKNSMNGVFRKTTEVYSQRIIMMPDENYYKIPTREINIDAFNLAVMSSILNTNKYLKIKYFKEDQKILINQINFPLVIERILFMNSILNGSFSETIFKREYYLENENFSYLNRLFKNKIKIT